MDCEVFPISDKLSTPKVMRNAKKYELNNQTYRKISSSAPEPTKKLCFLAKPLIVNSTHIA